MVCASADGCEDLGDGAGVVDGSDFSCGDSLAVCGGELCAEAGESVALREATFP